MAACLFYLWSKEQLVLLIICHKIWSRWYRLTHTEFRLDKRPPFKKSQAPLGLRQKNKKSRELQSLRAELHGITPGVNTSKPRGDKDKERGRKEGAGEIRFHLKTGGAATETVQWCEADLWKESSSRGRRGWSNSEPSVPTLWLRGDEEGRPTIISTGRFILGCIRGGRDERKFKHHSWRDDQRRRWNY